MDQMKRQMCYLSSYCYDEARKFNNIIYFKYKESIDYPEKSSRLIIKKLD